MRPDPCSRHYQIVKKVTGRESQHSAFVPSEPEERISDQARRRSKEEL